MIQRNDNTMASILNQDMVLMDVINGSFFGVNTIGRFIWQALEQPMSFDALLALLMKHYDVSESQCRQNTLAFLQQLEMQHLIIMSEDAVA